MKCYVTFVLQAVLMTSFCNWNTEWLHEMFYYYCNALLAGLPASSIRPLQLIQNAAARLIFNEPKRTHVTPLFINLHWLPIAAQYIKFKTLMFAYRTTSGSAPFTWIHYFRLICPLEACVLQVNDASLYIPKRHKITFTDFFINCSHPVTCLTQSEQLNPYHLQETAKNTSLPSLFDSLTLALSILILFYLICILFILKNTNIWPSINCIFIL